MDVSHHNDPRKTDRLRADGPLFNGLSVDILESIADGFYAVDRDWRIIYVNRRGCKMWGVEPDTVVGRVLWERFPELADTPADDRLRQAAGSGHASEYEAFSPVSHCWVWVRAYPIRDGIVGVYWRDITERKLADAALRDSEERLRLAIEATELGTWDIDFLEDRFTWSDRYREILGAPPDMPACQESFEALVHPDDLPVVLERQRRVKDQGSGGVYRSEYRTRGLRDGVERWVIATGRVLYDQSGRALRIVGTLLDITERKRLEQELRDSEERYRRFADAALEGVLVHDQEVVIDVSRRFADMFGYTPDEIIGKRIADLAVLVAPEDLAAAARRSIAGPDAFSEITGVRKDGTRFTAEYLSKTIGLEGRRVGIVRDITEHKRTEAELRRLTERLEARVEERTRELSAAYERLRRERQMSELLIESISMGIIGLDRTFRYTVWNPYMESITGMPRGEVLGRTPFEMFPYINGTPIEAGWRAAMEGRHSSVGDWKYSIPQTGRTGFMNQEFAPLYDEQHAIIGALAFVHDITEQHRVEEALRHAQKMEAVGQLTGGVAHDFNNLLTAIIGNLDHIASTATADEGVRRAAESALRSAGRGARLTQQLLAFSRRQTLRSELIDIGETLREAQTLLRGAAGEAIATTFDITDEPLLCVTDPAQMEAAVLNLVVNARDAMPQGGELRIAAAIVSTSPDECGDLSGGDYVVLSVHDTGIGMTPEVRERAFEPFFTTKEVGKGSGLGLSMVYGFAKQSAGTVIIDSAPGAGTTVRLYLPRATGTVSQSPVAMSDAVPRGSGTILVAEDDADVREVTVEMLSTIGYRVLVARDGQEALVILRCGTAVDLLLSDVVMPGGISGPELARQASQIQPGIKVLLTSGYTADRVTEPEGGGEFAFIAKPFRSTDLARRVADLMAEKGSHGMMPSRA